MGSCGAVNHPNGGLFAKTGPTTAFRFTLRPGASDARNNMAAVPAIGRTDCAGIRRRPKRRSGLLACGRSLRDRLGSTAARRRGPSLGHLPSTATFRRKRRDVLRIALRPLQFRAPSHSYPRRGACGSASRFRSMEAASRPCERREALQRSRHRGGIPFIARRRTGDILNQLRERADAIAEIGDLLWRPCNSRPCERRVS